METQKDPKPRVVCCIGDVHGYFTKLQNLWSNLETQIGPSDFEAALIIFLGDYCDRGPNTREVIDFLVHLPSKYPKQSHVFLCGNHDLAFAAFVGVLPPPPDPLETWKEYAASEDREGWYKGDGYQNMHLQGRRWAGSIKVRFNTVKGTEYKGSIYDAAPTFESYGVPHGSAEVTNRGEASARKADEMDQVYKDFTGDNSIGRNGRGPRIHVADLHAVK